MPNLDSTNIADLGQLLTTLQDGINTRVFEESLPIIGNNLASVSNDAVDFIDNINSAVQNRLNAIPNLANVTVEEITTALNEALGPGGLNLLSSAISVPSGTDEFIFDIQLVRTASNFSTLIESNFGIPGVGLELSGNANVDVGFNFNLRLGLNSEGFFIDTSANNELGITLNTSTPYLNASGELGFLSLNATDNGTSFNGTFSVDLTDSASDSDTQLTVTEIPSVINSNFGNLINAELTADTNINLHLVTGFGEEAVFPQLSTDFVVNWDFTSANIDAYETEFGNLPTVAFNNVQLDLGTFFNNFASPVLDNVRQITEPIQPIIDVLTTPINLRIAQFNLLGIAEELGALDQEDLDFIESVAQLTQITNSIPTGSERLIDLGSFNLGNADVRVPGFALSSINPNITLTAPSVDEQLSDDSPEANFISSFNSIPGGGLQFPLLTDPMQAFYLLLGKDATLFTYNMPRLDFNFDYSQFFPIIGPLGAEIRGQVGAAVDLAFGYDTTGFRQFNNTGNTADIFNGFFVSDPVNPDETEIPEVTLNASLEAFAALNAGVASAGVGGGISGNVFFDLRDPNNDGQVRVDEFAQIIQNPLDLFNTSGQLTAGLSAFVRLGFGIFSYTRRFNSPRVTLLNYENNNSPTTALLSLSYGDNSKPQIQSDLLLASQLNGQINGVDANILLLHLGPDAAARQGNNTIDGDEVFTVEHQSNSACNENVSVSAFGLTQEYTSVDLIVADGGEGNDRIKLNANVLTPADLAGGNGNDQLYGGAGNDLLDGGCGSDELFGRTSDDLLIGGSGADILDGGEGSDTASYITADTGVSASLATGEGSAGDATGDKFCSIENLVGSEFNDSLEGNSENNILYGGVGDDQLSGGTGDDTLYGGEGDNILCGGSGSDVFALTAGVGASTIIDFDICKDLLGLTEGLTFEQLSITQSTCGNQFFTQVNIACTGDLLAILNGVQAYTITSSLFTIL